VGANPSSADSIMPAIGLRLLSVALFACMNTGIKLAEQGGAALGEILFFRQLGASVLVSGVVLAGPGLGSLRSKRMAAHVSRATVGLISMAFTFAALLALPLAEATTIGFSMPIFATVLGALLLGEPTGWRRWAAVLAGFVGVVIVTQPGIGGRYPLWGGLCGLMAAFLTAVISILLRQLGRTERPLTTVFWFSTLSLVPLGAVYAATARAHPAHVWLMLGGLGLFGGAAQLAMTGSLARGAVSVVVPMDYTALIWATCFGWLVFGTLPGNATWFGAPVIVASGLYIVWREHVRRREETRQAAAQGIA
jgi:drug/metabolite transporter (DMT)-like permease